MKESNNSVHKSLILAIRKATALYLFEQKREKDIPQIAKIFLPLKEYHGERVPLSIAAKETNALCSMLQDDYLGLNLNILINIEILPFYKAINECIRPFSNIKSKLPLLLVSRILYRFAFLISQSISLRLAEEAGSLRFDFISNVQDMTSKHQIDGAMVIIYRILEELCPGMLKKIYIAHRKTSYELRYYRYIFSVPVELADKTSLVYDLDCKNHYKDASSLLIKSQEELGRMLNINPLANMLVAQFPEMSYKQRCEMFIDIMRGIRPLDRKHIADLMNISVSTLQRKLKEEDTSFQEILEGTRRQLAKLYLTENKLSTTDISCLLGYKSHSQFFKIFKIWFGVTPKTYRNNLMSRK